MVLFPIKSSKIVRFSPEKKGTLDSLENTKLTSKDLEIQKYCKIVILLLPSGKLFKEEEKSIEKILEKVFSPNIFTLVVGIPLHQVAFYSSVSAVYHVVSYSNNYLGIIQNGVFYLGSLTPRCPQLLEFSCSLG